MAEAAAALRISPRERNSLRRLAYGGAPRRRVAVRARILLKSALGWSNRRIARATRTSRPTVLLWRRRYVERGLKGIVRDAPRSGRPRGRRG